MTSRFPASWGSVAVLAGGIAIGWALNATVVTGRSAVTDPLPLSVLLGGVALVYAGYRLQRQFDPSAYSAVDDGDDEETFDEQLSPVRESWLEDRERDDSYDR